MGVYNHARGLNTALRNLKTLDITEQNKQDIRDFLHYIASHRCSITRQVKYIYPLQNITRWLGKDFIKATKEDIQTIVEFISVAKKDDNTDLRGIDELKNYIDRANGTVGESKYRPWTKQDYNVVIRKFYKWLYNRNNEDEDEWEYPKVVKFIKVKKPKDSKRIPSDLINPEDVRFLVEHCRTLREKALILVLYESGARIGEILNLKIKDTAFDDYGVRLNLFGKTGHRTIRLVGSAPELTQWLTEEHPTKNDRNSYLFCNVNKGKKGTQLSYFSVKKMLNNLKKESGFQKPINPHHFRHSRATELAEHLSDSVRCQYFGWVQGSDMARIYTHMVDTDRIILEMNGLIPKEKDRKGKFTFIICPRCGTKNPYGSDLCSRCYLGLDAITIKEYDDKGKSIFKEFKQFKEMVENMIMPEFWEMKQKLDRIDQEQSDIEIKEQWVKKANEHFAEQERLYPKVGILKH